LIYRIVAVVSLQLFFYAVFSAKGRKNISYFMLSTL
jgi:hypothetical protein